MTISDAFIMDGESLPNIPTDNQPIENLDLTPIQTFYKDANIFITGSTGFLGKILIEKLLRSCPDLSTLYLLIRNKKGKNLHTRIDEIFDDVVFERMKKEFPKFRHKIIGVAGDCSMEDLGLSLEDQKELMEKVNIIFHVAATVRFDEKLKMAVAINIRAPRDISTLAHRMPNLRSLIHVSTAYANCINRVIEEKFYPPAMDHKQLISMTENLPESIIDNITTQLLDKYPNTYAFTKQVAEDTVKQCADGLPLGIFRPAIVVSTYKEPIKAWINNMYGPTGVVAGAGIGLLRTLHCDAEINANIVPVDMCVNSLIASAWDVAETYETSKMANEDYQVPIYNYESSNDNPISWKNFMENSQEYGFRTPCNKAIWYYSFRTIKNFWLYTIFTFFLHTIPALIVDGALLCIGKQPRTLKVYSRIHKFSAVLSYFALNSWVFRSNNVQRLCQKLSNRDKELFFSDLKQLNWTEFFEDYLKGVRVYLVRDPMSSLPEAKKRFQRLYWLHQTVKAVVAFLMLRIIWFLGSLFYSL